MVESSYWSKVLNGRISRRRTLAATGGAALSTAFLAACGGGDDEGVGRTGSTGVNGAAGGSGTGGAATGGSGTGGTGQPVLDETGLVALPIDETSMAQRGGVMIYNHANTETTVDPGVLNSNTSSELVAPVYSLFVKYGKVLAPGRPGPDLITGDAMTSWEPSPDGLSVTYKLRPNHKLDPRPPTNGRAVTTEDVKWSFERTEALAPIGGILFRSASEDGFIDGLEVIDNETVKVNLVEPYGALNEALAFLYLYIAPIEGENQFNMAVEMRGSGPFRLERWDSEVVAEFRKNDDWYEDRPFVDGFDMYFIQEPSQIDAQFLNKTIWRTATAPQEILRMKDSHPELLMTAEMPRLSPGSYTTTLGRAFTDVRMRRAASMLWDRDLLIQSVYNTDVWTERGIDVPIIWDGHLCSNAVNWIDPKGDGLGDGAKWFQYNPEEAKALMDAAGYAGQEVDYIRRQVDGIRVPLGDVMSQMLKAGGFNIVQRVIDRQETVDLKFAGPAGYDGVFFQTANGFNDEGYLLVKYTEGGRDRAIDKNVPGISDLILQAQREFDNERKVQLINDVQKLLANEMFDLPSVSTQPTLGFELIWPWLRNTHWAVQGFSSPTSSGRPYLEYYIDQELKERYG